MDGWSERTCVYCSKLSVSSGVLFPHHNLMDGDLIRKHFFSPSFQDQYDRLSLHTQKGIEFLDRYGNFIKDRSAIENEYAGKLRSVYYHSFDTFVGGHCTSLGYCCC